MELAKYMLGDLLEPSEDRNENLNYDLKDVKGISIHKVFIETKANMDGVSLHSYYLVRPDDFVYVTVTSRNGEKITLAHNDTESVYIVSSSYVVFRVKSKDILLSDYLFMYFNRPEFDRYARFNSWGSARETFSWEDMCDIEIVLPDITTQQKYVDIYKAMVANQQSYERGLEDLKQTYYGLLDQIKHSCKKLPVGKLLSEIDERNTSGDICNVQGINITKQFMPTVADINGIDLTKYKVVKQGWLAFSGMQTGRDMCIRIAMHVNDAPIIVSPAYTIFKVYSNMVMPEYIMCWFSRLESDRLGWFMSDSSIRSNLDLDRLYETKIPVPDTNIQQSIVDLYKTYTERRRINEQLKAQIKAICPILIRGSLMEGSR